jgi:L-threonylcarbamoyladenylate synthase
MTDPTRISRIVAANEETARAELERCVRVGGVVLFPTDTVYGLGCDPSDPDAIDRIHALKGRPEGKPSAVMFFSPLAMRELVATLGSRTRDALAALLPGPVTVVVHNPQRRYPLACGDDPERLGVRLIDGPLAGAGCALFQTSANRSGAPDASTPEEIDAEIAAGADLMITAGELTGTASTVVDVSGLDSGGRWKVLREGAMPHDELASRLGPIG